MEKVSSLGDLGPLMPDLARTCNMDIILTLDNFVHRLCGFQQVKKKYFHKISQFDQLPKHNQYHHHHSWHHHHCRPHFCLLQIHSTFRSNWHYNKEPLDPFNTFVGLDQLEERGTKAQDVIKVEDLLFEVEHCLISSL